MKIVIATIIYYLALVHAVGIRAADFDSEITEARKKLEPDMRSARELVNKGQANEATQKFLEAFPEGKRTAVESLMLGDILFQQDHKVSYALHKAAAKELPNELRVQYEWTLEQHRSGEYKGAAEGYEAFIKMNPNFAPILGLYADCLIRNGKIREAVNAWNDSENATDGTLEQMETLSFEVHNHKMLDIDRSNFLAKAKQGDIDAAEKLIMLDCEFEVDWWNKEPRYEYLENDLTELQKVKFADQDRLREILCAGGCTLAMKEEGKEDAEKLLQKSGFMIDPKETLPKSPLVLSTLLGVVQKTKLLSLADARKKWGDELLKRAKAEKSAELFNVAAVLYQDTDQQQNISKQGWEETGDKRFAGSYLTGLAVKAELKLDNPELQKAIAKFPDDAILAHLMVDLTAAQGGKVYEDALLQAIKAEYSHFSPQGPFFFRVGAKNLRGYFLELDKVLAAKK